MKGRPSFLGVNHSKDTRNKWLREQIAALRATRNLAVHLVLSRFLRSVRLALYLARSLIPCIPNIPKNLL